MSYNVMVIPFVMYGNYIHTNKIKAIQMLKTNSLWSQGTEVVVVNKLVKVKTCEG